MKVPPKRKGNTASETAWDASLALNESPSEKEGKLYDADSVGLTGAALNESPSEKEGKWAAYMALVNLACPSMKVPPKRKGNQLPAPRPTVAA